MQQVSTAKGAAARMSKGRKKPNSQRFWLPMESSPEVMTKFLHLTGVPDDFELRDLPSLEEGDLAEVVGDPGDVLAVIFLLPKDLDIIVSGGSVVDMFYIKDTFDNSSGPVALINAVVNIPTIKIKDGSALDEFVASINGKTPDERGDALAEEENLASILASVSASCTSSGASADHRFITIVKAGARLVLMDGIKDSGPLSLGPDVEDGEFAARAVGVCKDIVSSNPGVHGFSAFLLIKK